MFVSNQRTFAGKWLICIFSYNRAAYLQNLLESITRFYPDFDVAVFDDMSEDSATGKLLAALKQKGTRVITGDADTTKSKHGGLYTQMNEALNYAIEQGFDYAYFVQDDMQFLWRDETLEIRVKEVFGYNECVMCNCNFLQKILKAGIEERLPWVKECAFSFKGNGVADTGIINLQKAKYIGLHFPCHSESGNGRYWHDRNYRLYWLPQPHLAWVPWPTTYRNKSKESRNPRFLNPLSADAINKLAGNNSYVYLEDYTSIQGWAIKPYWYTANPGFLNLLKIYFKYYLAI